MVSFGSGIGLEALFKFPSFAPATISVLAILLAGGVADHRHSVGGQGQGVIPFRMPVDFHYIGTRHGPGAVSVTILSAHCAIYGESYIVGVVPLPGTNWAGFHLGQGGCALVSLLIYRRRPGLDYKTAG